MDIFNVLTMVGGLSLFLFGMSLMGQALERRAGNKLRALLDKMTGNVFMGFLTGLGITAIMQSSLQPRTFLERFAERRRTSPARISSSAGKESGKQR